MDQFGCLDVSGDEIGRHAGVFAVRLFPASEPENYISLRTWDRDGREQEVGLIRSLKDWPETVQEKVCSALARRYLLRVVTGIDSIRVDFGNLQIALRTEYGPCSIQMRWSQAQVQDFGAGGKVLIDVEDNRYLVRDVQSLPVREREIFQRFIYW